MYGSMVFLLGAAIASLFGFTELFARTSAEYLGPLGVAVVSFSIFWAGVRFRSTSPSPLPVSTTARPRNACATTGSSGCTRSAIRLSSAAWR